MGPVIVAGSLDVAAAIIAESTLSFLGLGFPPDIPTWGRILFDAKDNLDLDRKSTRLNSSHSQISYAVFCLKKKKNTLLRGFPLPSRFIQPLRQCFSESRLCRST